MAKENIAIDKDEINKLILEITDCRDNIKVILSKINDLIDETKNYYTCSSANNLRTRYYVFNDNYKIILSNIKSYANDLISLKKKYALTMNDLSNNIENETKKISDARFYKEGR